MSWGEISPGVFQRPLGAQETPSVSPSALAQGITREPIRIHTFADLTASHSCQDTVRAFGDAWTAVRLLQSPEIAATHQDGQKRYKVPSAQELDTWHKRTYRVAPAGTSIEAVVREMQQEHELLPVLYMIPKSTCEETFKGSLILFISHWMTEASGAFMIVNQLCDYASDLLEIDSETRKALSQRDAGSEVNLLTPTLEDMFMPNRKPSSTESKQRIQAYFDHFTKQQPRLDFPSKPSARSDTKPSHMMSNQRIYSTASTSSLVAACKAKGISVAAALHSAYLAAVWQLASADRQSRAYACFMPAQMRARLPASSPYKVKGCWNSARLLFVTAPAGQDFITRATALRRQYMLAQDEHWLHDDIYEMNEQTTDYFVKTANESIAMPYYTSMGLLDGNIITSDHGNVQLNTVSVWADSLGLAVVLGQWTFRGCLNLQVSWNFAFHEEEQVQMTMDAIDTILNKELGVGLKVEDVRKRTC